MKWIGAVKGKQPFYAYIALNAPHSPLQVPKEYEQKYTGKVGTNVAKFFGMIANIDDNVGRLLAKLNEWGIDRDTLVVFMNDNGGTAGLQVFNAGMHGGKNSPWLGGTRAASFWRWPGTFKPADVNALAANIDFFPTIAELAGAKLSGPVQAQVEGRSLVPLLKNPSCALARPAALHAHRPVGKGTGGAGEVSRLQCAQQPLAPGVCLEVRGQAMAVVRCQSRPR